MNPIMKNGYLTRGDIRSLEKDLMQVDLNAKDVKDWIVNEFVYSVTQPGSKEELDKLIQLLKEKL